MNKYLRSFVTILGLLIIIFLSGCASGSATAQLPAGQVKPDIGIVKRLPAFELNSPQDGTEIRYLGLPGTGNFKIGQIKAQFLIIEVFNFYCPHCQKAASQVNELYQKIQGRPDIKDKIRMIGLGAGNSNYEVNSFRERYQVPFPLFPDQSMDIAKMLGVRGTPTFIGVTVNGKGYEEQFYFHEGTFQDTGQFLDEIVKFSGFEAQK
jgi:thiol-disulfide isomerase/thioredoxin